MSSLMGSHGMALATATAMAVSGTVILMALCRPRPLSVLVDDRCDLRPCITSAERRKINNHKKKKSVRFGEDVIVEFNDHFNDGNGNGNDNSSVSDDESTVVKKEETIVMTTVPEIKNTRNVGPDRAGYKAREMPANRAALYSGILQARMQRMACY